MLHLSLSGNWDCGLKGHGFTSGAWEGAQHKVYWLNRVSFLGEHVTHVSYRA